MTRSFRGSLVVGSAALLAFLAACSSSSDGTATARPTETAAATETEAPSNGGGDGVLFGGKEVGEFYTLNCSSCHGQAREGINGLGLPLVPDRLTEDDAFYFDTIKNGRPPTVMPAWGDAGLSDDEINALVAFIRTEP